MATTGYRCTCCRLIQTVASASPGLCTTCRYHQSLEINQTVKRYSEHEDMLRERFQAASKHAEEATVDRKAFGEKMHWAIRSRDRTIWILRQISDMHELRPDGRCKCGDAKSCKVAHLLDDRGIQQLIRRVDDHEAEMKRKEQIYREMEASGDPSRWEEFLRDAAGGRDVRPESNTG